MEENTTSVNERIAKNLIYYRKAAGLTQAELAEKINYSDKSVSKWELGHGAPDVYVLLQLAELYSVSLNDLVGGEEKKVEKPSKRGLRTLVILLASGIVWLVATCLFVLFSFLPVEMEGWLFFLYAVPVNAIVALVLACVWRFKLLNFLSVSLLIWSTLACVFLSVLVIGHAGEYSGLWLIFLLGIPLQALEILWVFFRYSVFKGRLGGKKEKKKDG